MKKLFKFILLVLTLSACLSFAAFGCGESKEEEKQITLNASEINLSLNASSQISASVEGVSMPILEYSVDKPNVVTVDSNGNIIANSVGTAIITVKYGSATKTCEVTVGLGDYLPSISLESDEGLDFVEIAANSSYTFNPKIIYNNVKYSDAIYTFTIDNTDLGTFSGNSFIASSVQGTSKVTVTASWRNSTSMFLTKQFNIKVLDKVIFSINNGTFGGDVCLYTAPSHQGINYPTSQTYNISVIKNGVEVEKNSSNYNVEILNSQVASFNFASNTISARNAGKTKINITYREDDKEYLASFNIEVLRPVCQLTNKVTAFSAKTESFNVDTILGTSNNVLTDATQNGVSLDVDGNKILGLKSISTGVNESIIEFYTNNKVGYRVIVEVYSFVVKTQDDLKYIATYCDGSVAIANDIYVTDNSIFSTISNLKGTIDGLGHTIYDLKVEGGGDDGGGLIKLFSSGSKLCNIAFVNMKSSVSDSAKQVYLGGNFRANGAGTIENVFISTDMKNPDGTQKTKNSAIFNCLLTGVKINNLIIEYPSIKLDDSNGYGLFATNQHYGMFLTALFSDTIGQLSVTNWNSVFVISKSINGPMPMFSYSKNQNYGESKGAYKYVAYASNDVPSVTAISNRYATKGTYEGLEKNLYWFEPLYKLDQDKETGEITYTLLDTQNPSNYSETDERPTAFTPNESDLIGAGIMKFGKALKRYDDYSSFVTTGVAIGTFASSSCWNITSGVPVWANSVGNNVKLLSNGEEVDKISLIFDQEDSSKKEAQITLTYGGTNVPCTLNVVSNNNVVTVSGTKISAINGGVEFVEASFIIDGKTYKKYINVEVDVKPGEFEYDKTLEFSASNGKFYKKSADSKSFEEVNLSEIFGIDVTLNRATIDGRKLVIKEGVYPTGYAATESEVYLKDVVLTSKATTYTVHVNVYGMIIMCEEDLKTLNIPNPSTKITGYFVVGKDITCTSDAVINKHFDFYGSGGTLSTDSKKFGFHGEFNGLGHTISGLYLGIGSYDKSSGIFGYIGEGVKISNIAFTDLKYDSEVTKDNMRMTNVFAYKMNGNLTLENIYVQYNEMFINRDASVGLFWGIHDTVNIKNVIVDMPTPSDLSRDNYFGYGFTTRMGSYPQIFKDKNVFMIAKPNPNGRILPVANNTFDGSSGAGHLSMNVIIAKNDYTDLIDSVVTKEDVGAGHYIYYAENSVNIDPQTRAMTQGPSDKVMLEANTVAVSRTEIERYDDYAALRNRINKVGNWRVTDTGVVWEQDA